MNFIKDLIGTFLYKWGFMLMDSENPIKVSAAIGSLAYQESEGFTKTITIGAKSDNKE